MDFIVGGGKQLKSLRQETETHLLSGSLKRQSLVMFVELMLLPEGQRESGYDSGIILSGPLWAKHMALWDDA